MKASPFNQRTITEFRAKKGRGVGIFGDNLLLMTVKGAKSGEAIMTPLVYGREGKDYVVVVSKGGAPDNPQTVRSETGSSKRCPKSGLHTPITRSARRA